VVPRRTGGVCDTVRFGMIRADFGFAGEKNQARGCLKGKTGVVSRWKWGCQFHCEKYIIINTSILRHTSGKWHPPVETAGRPTGDVIRVMPTQQVMRDKTKTQEALGVEAPDLSFKTLILAGGSGTRLFPLSRELYPKQFIPLFGGESLFQKTLLRSLLHSEPDGIVVVTNERHRFLVRDQTEGICPGCQVLVEPAGRNTLPAIYYGVAAVEEADGDSSVIVYPSDHLLAADGAYLQALAAAARLARERLVTFGIKPTYPHTGYGYIHPGAALGGDGYLVEQFIEKPDSVAARAYVAEGYLWNSGMFCFESRVFLDECDTCAPDVAAAFAGATPEQAFARVPSISVDYGIMEKTGKAAVVALDAPWNDLGSFEALYQTFDKNGGRNAIRGEHVGIDSEENLIISDRLVATIGVSGMAIIDTKDALLVCPRERSQEVGTIVGRMRVAGDERVVMHNTVHRPWGKYTGLEAGDRYQIKRISVPPGRRLSLQMHHHRSEHWVVVKGTAKVTKGREEFLLRNGESTFVPAGVTHRLENTGIIPLEIIEVQIGEYVGEDDIFRFEDDFGRERGDSQSGAPDEDHFTN
jgi:mannose-1-phosphate guanylyltransferase/mannose-6-phosphate isomerase